MLLLVSISSQGIIIFIYNLISRLGTCLVQADQLYHSNYFKDFLDKEFPTDYVINHYIVDDIKSIKLFLLVLKKRLS